MKVGNNRFEWWLEEFSDRTLLYMHAKHVHRQGFCFISVKRSDGSHEVLWSTDGGTRVGHRMSFRVDGRLLRPSSVPSCNMRADGTYAGYLPPQDCYIWARQKK